MPVKIFINYRRDANLREAQHLATLLAAKFGKSSVFLDLRGIGGAENWMEKLQEQVDACDLMIVLISKDWTQSTNAQGQRRMEDANDPLVYEIARALRNRMPVLPILIDGATMPEAAELPKSLWVLTLQHGMPLRNEFFGPDTAEIVAAIKRRVKELGRRRKAPAWIFGVASIAMVASGMAAGPWVSGKLGLSLPGAPEAPRQEITNSGQAYNASMEALANEITLLRSRVSINFTSNLSYMDAETKSVMAAGDAEILNQVVEAGIQKLTATNSKFIFNVPGHTLVNNDTNARKLSDIFWDANMSKTEKVDKIINEMMTPSGIDLLIAGQYQQKADGSIILRPFVISRLSKNTATESKTFTQSEFACTDPKNRRKTICAKAAEDIKDIVIRLLTASQ
jgi:hypothetical protein